MSIRHIIAVALIDADTNTVEASTGGKTGVREAESDARIAKLSASDFM